MKPVPATLDWDLWLGPAPWRPYSGRRFITRSPGAAGGTSAPARLGDMACHTCNLPFMALNMRDPIAVEAECPEHDGDSYPARSKIKYEFPELNGRAAFTMYWYDGGNMPPNELFKDVTLTVKQERHGRTREIPAPHQAA